MSSRLADRLNVARHRRFAGREAEIALFQATLSAAELPFILLHVFGPGGVGKTTLLHEFTRLCQQANLPAIHLDARTIEPSPESFLGALQQALGLTAPQSPLAELSLRSQRQVIIIDTFEKLAPLEPWLRDFFLPELPGETLVVVSSQQPPSPAWLADPGWQSLIRLLPLRNFSPEESRAYLAHRQVHADQHPAILDFTHGHPLALSLVADVLTQRQDSRQSFKPEAAPDIIRILLEQLVQKVPGPAHRAALEACALVHLTTEAVLAAMLALPDPSTVSTGEGVHELFDWLRGLSCIELGPQGLFPHDLAREALAADLRWRNPDWYAELHRRARAYYAQRLAQTRGREQQTILMEYIFLHRDNPVVRPFFIQLQAQWAELGGLITDMAREADWPRLVAMIVEHEGEESARLARHWFAQQPQNVVVLRDAGQQPVGFVLRLTLPPANPADITLDPAVEAAWRYLQTQAPLRPGEQATLFRFWLAADTYQGVSTVQGHLFILMVQHYLTTPGLAFTFLPCRQPDFWQPVLTYADLTRLPQADFTLEGRSYGVYGHDWRTVPPLTWLDLLAQRETTSTPPVAPAPTQPTLIVLSQPEFETAVRHLLRDFRVARPDVLRYNPLLWSRLVADHTGANADEAGRVAALQALVKEAAAQLQTSPRQRKFYQALYRTYFQPAPTQEQAAELLDLPFSTYRRHLKIGIELLTQLLWQREMGGLAK